MAALLGAVGLVIVALLFFIEFYKARGRTLPLNSAFGLRTRAIMRDESTWEETHARYAPFFFVDGVLFAGASIVLAGAFFSEKLSGISNYAVLTVSCLVLLVTVIGGIMATRFAQDLNRKVK